MHRPHFHRPYLKSPLDADDARALLRVAIYSMLLIWSAVIVALAAGLAVRVFLAVM